MSQAQEVYSAVLASLSLKNKEAWDRFKSLGWDSIKESYQHVRLAPLMMHSFQQAQSYKERTRSSCEYFVHVCTATGKILNSRLPKGIYLMSYNEAALLYGSILRPIVQKRVRLEHDLFASINRAFAPLPSVIYISPKVVIESVIEVKFFSQTAHESLAFPQWMMIGGKESETKWQFEGHHEGALTWSNRLFDLHLEPRARIDFKVKGYLSAQQESLRAHLEKQAVFKYTSLFCQEGFSRQDFHVSLAGEEAEVDLQGVSLVSGESQAHTSVCVEHKALCTRSNQKFKNVVSGKGRTSFEGKIYVHPQAQQTEAYQLCNSLLLGEEGRAYSKPNLEIFADDVKASHGTTVGQVNEEALFYLLSRGIAQKEAKLLLIEGFLADILEGVQFSLLSREQFFDVTKTLLS